jgi:hypothetical protein
MNKRQHNLDRLVESVIFENILHEDATGETFMPGSGAGNSPATGNVTMARLAITSTPEGTTGDELPLAPSPETSMQLTAKLPPVDDEEYTPTSSTEFGSAMQALADGMDSNELQKLFRAIRKNLNKKMAEGVIAEALPKKPLPKKKVSKPAPSSYWDDMSDEELYADMTPEEIEAEKKEFEATASEMGKSEPHVSWADIGTKKDPISKIRGTYDDDDGFDDIAEPIEVAPGGMNLDDMAKELGLAGPSGAKQAVGRIVRRLNTIQRLLTPDEITGLHAFATIQFIKEITPLVDKEDVDELKLNRDIVKGLDSYKFFFVNSFITPIYNKIYRNAKLDIQQKLVDAGFPKLSATTVSHVLFGESETTPEKLRRKLEKDVKKESSALSVDELLERLKELYPALRDISRLESFDIGEMARERWDGLSKSRKAKYVTSALDETQAFQDELDAKND